MVRHHHVCVAASDEGGHPIGSSARHSIIDRKNLLAQTRRNKQRRPENLGRCGPRAVPAIPFLIRLADDYDPIRPAADYYTIAKEARCTLARLGQPAVDGIVAALRVTDYRGEYPAHYFVMDAFRLMPGELAVPASIEILENENPKIRAKAAAMLCLFPDKRAVEPLIRHLKDSNESVIGSAAPRFGMHRRPPGGGCA